MRPRRSQLPAWPGSAQPDRRPRPSSSQGANIGDWFGLPKSEQGLGVGVFGTSLIFLGAILATVIYLSLSRADVIEEEEDAKSAPASTPERRRISLGVLAATAVATVSLLAWANAQPHTSSLAEEGPAPSCSGSPLDQAAATVAVAKDFPASSVDGYRTIVVETQGLVDSGDQSAAQSRITDLESAWDDDESTLQPKNCQAWTYVDTQIDAVLSAVRDSSPDQATEDQAMTDLLTTLG